MNIRFGDYQISDDKKKLDLDVVHGLLKRSYWADKRSRETLIRAVENSRCFGVYDANGRQVAFARVITDNSTMFYLCDVIVDESYRGSGIGKTMVESIVQSDELRGLSGHLATVDAFGLYEKYGFHKEPDKYMRKPPQEEAGQ
ncbi:MAG: GCN5-related N-acetyltransferase [Cohnella sp.]|nr:GCN5-related N-acetyltransferase [Cohnella sp.]